MTDQKGQLIKMKGEGVSLTASPAKTMQDGTRVAKVLVTAVKQNGWAVNIQGHEFLQYEAWQTIAQFYGCSVSTSELPVQVKYGEVEGFQTKASIIDKKTGLVIGGATALCLNDEKNWKGKPLFQLSSMAQTRAGAKALRQMFSWVVVLAGYRATPAEEMDEVTIDPKIKSELKGESSTGQVNVQTDPFDRVYATEPQIKLLKSMVRYGQVEDQDFGKLTKKEASALIARGIGIKNKVIQVSEVASHQA